MHPARHPHERDVTIGAGIDDPRRPVRERARAARPLRLDPVHLPVEPRVAQRVGHRRLHGNVNMLPAPGDMPRVQRDHRRRARVERRQRVGLLHAGTQRRAIAVAAERHQPARRCADQVRRRPVRLGPRLAERRHRDVDQLRRERAQLLKTQPAPAHRARWVRLKEEVRLARKRPQPLAIPLVVQVEHDAALARVHLRPIERAAFAPVAVAQKRSAPPRRMPAGRLDANHIHAEAGQDARGQRADLGRQIQRAVGRQRSRLPSCLRCLLSGHARRLSPARDV